MVHNERLVVSEIAVGQPVHQPVSQRVQSVGGAGLRNACAAAAERTERRDIDDRGAGESGVRWSGEVHVKLEKIQVVRTEIQQVIWRSRGWGGGAVELGRVKCFHIRVVFT